MNGKIIEAIEYCFFDLLIIEDYIDITLYIPKSKYITDKYLLERGYSDFMFYSRIYIKEKHPFYKLKEFNLLNFNQL